MATKYWYALDYYNTIPQIAEGNVLIRRPFSFCVNSTAGSINGVAKVTSLASTGPDALACCTFPGQGFGICITNYYLDIDKVDAGGGSAALVLKMGIVLTSTVTGLATTLDPTTGAASMASDSYFFTLLTPGNAAVRVNPVSAESNASTPAEVPITYGIGKLPLMLTNFTGNTGGNVGTYPDSGLYDLVLTVTTTANALTSTDLYIKGWVDYFTLNQPWQV
jgi:hypothetical protein